MPGSGLRRRGVALCEGDALELALALALARVAYGCRRGWGEPECPRLAGRDSDLVSCLGSAAVVLACNGLPSAGPSGVSRMLSTDVRVLLSSERDGK